MHKQTSVSLFKVLVYVVAFGSVYSHKQIVLAQVVPDRTLNTESSTVKLAPNSSNREIIDGGAVRGSNLFHSFTQFSVGEGKEVIFTPPTGVQSIFSRVTSNNPSQILGNLGVVGSASLFLVNPNGIIFGAKANLDLNGSFIATTANRIDFADGNTFAAQSQIDRPLLTSSVPLGLQFGAEPKNIQVEGSPLIIRSPEDLIDIKFGLQVEPDQTLALVGGDISLIGGTIKSAGGQVVLGSVDSYSSIKLVQSQKGWNLEYSEVSNFQDILLDNRSLINLSGEGSGSADLTGRSITIQNGSQIEASTFGSISGGKISLNATDSINLIGGSGERNNSSGLTAQVYQRGTGNGSSIDINTKNLNLGEGAQIITGTYGQGSAGNLTVTADSIKLTGVLPANIFVNSGIFTSVNPGATGNAGSLTIETKDLLLADGAQIFSGTLGAGSASNLTIRANSITLNGTTPSENQRFGSAIATSVDIRGTGNAANLTIETKNLNLTGGALISSSSFGTGKAGNLNITADSVKLSGTSRNGRFPSRLTTRSTGTNSAGNLAIESKELIINDGASVTASSSGSGNAGSLRIDSDFVQLANSSSIVTESNSGQGGNINLISQNLLLRNNSSISASAGNEGASGNGGNIDINTGTLVGLENSNITANAFNGTGGNIEIKTQGLFLSPDSKISADSERGIDGVVDIQTLGFDVRNTITPLQNNLISPEQIVAGSCLARRSAERSSFVITGSGGLPVNPYSEIEEWETPAKSQSTLLDSVQPEGNSQGMRSPLTTPSPKKWKLGDPIVEAQGIVKLADGRVLLGMKPQNPASAKSLICKS